MNSQTGKFTAAGKVDAVHPGGQPLFDGQVSCINNPHTTCEADFKIGSFELNAPRTEVEGSFEQEPNKFSGRLAVDGKERLSGSASMTEGETEAVYQVKGKFDENEQEISLKTKNARKQHSEPQAFSV